MFAQHQFLSETVPLCVEEVACPCSAHHLHKDGPGEKEHYRDCVSAYKFNGTGLLKLNLSILIIQVASTYFDLALATGKWKTVE